MNLEKQLESIEKDDDLSINAKRAKTKEILLEAIKKYNNKYFKYKSDLCYLFNLKYDKHLGILGDIYTLSISYYDNWAAKSSVDQALIREVMIKSHSYKFKKEIDKEEFDKIYNSYIQNFKEISNKLTNNKQK